MSSGQQAGGGGEAAASGGLGRLTESEQKLVAKLLSDPTFFPIEFRTWLKQFFEGSGIIITASQIQGGEGTNIATGLPAGVIVPVAASGAIPVDCLICDGSAKVRTDYPLLFDRIGVAWGAGDGSTTFNIPDFRDRALYGAGGAVAIAQTDGVAFGSRGGPAHHHDINQTTGSAGGHSHGGGTGNAGGHQHPGVGDHQHGPSNQNFAETGGATAALGSGGTSRYVIGDYHFYTLPAGGHQHGGVGDHSHSIGSDGAHTHSLVGPTSGGYLSDRASFAGVIYVISIGTAA